MTNESEDVFFIVTTHHRELDELFEQIDRTRAVDLARARRLFDLLTREMAVYRDALERVLYPQLAALDIVPPTVTRGRDEQRTALVLADEIRRMSVEDEAWADALHTLGRLMRHHAVREEARIFPEARAALEPEQLRDLARQLRRVELELSC